MKKLATVRDAIEQTRDKTWVYHKTGDRAFKVASTLLGEIIDSPLWSVNTPGLFQEILQDTLHTTGNKPATINRQVACLSAVLNTIQAAAPDHPWQRVRAAYCRVPRTTLRTVSDREFLLILHGLGEHTKALARFLHETGVRLGEIYKFDESRVTAVGEGVVTFTLEDTKNGDARVVCCSEKLMTEVISARHFISARSLQDKFRVSADAMGRTDVTLKTLRHTRCTELIRQGVPLPVVQLWMGHRNIQTTMGYVHATDADLLKAFQGMNS
jgi:integrase